MNIDEIIARIFNHPWVVMILALTFFGCNFLAWMRIRREGSKDYRRPRLPLT